MVSFAEVKSHIEGACECLKTPYCIWKRVFNSLLQKMCHMELGKMAYEHIIT
jgi:hypothetical protein